MDSAANDPGAPRRLGACALTGIGLALLATLLAQPLPLTTLVTTRQGWTVLLVTTGALGASVIGPIRRIGAGGARLGYPALYLVLAALGAQASLHALRLAPVWIAVGIGTAALHGLVMMLGGRWLRLPFGMVATASQANLGGVVSTPLVGAVYDQRLVPVGLLLAIACNAVGTYLGLLSASIARWLSGHPL